jgi:membrane protein required for colicin V production
VVWIGFNLVAEFIEKVKLKEFDRQVGALFGFAKGVLLCVLITLFAVTLLSEPQRQAICNSRSGYYIAILLDKADAVMPGEVHQVLGPYIDRLDREIAHPHSGPAAAPAAGNWQWAKDLFSAGGIFGKSDSSGAQPPASIPALPDFPQSFPTGGDIIRAQPAGSFDPQMADRPGNPTAPPRPAGDFRRW